MEEESNKQYLSADEQVCMMIAALGVGISDPLSKATGERTFTENDQFHATSIEREVRLIVWRRDTTPLSHIVLGPWWESLKRVKGRSLHKAVPEHKQQITHMLKFHL